MQIISDFSINKYQIIKYFSMTFWVAEFYTAIFWTQSLSMAIFEHNDFTR